MSSRGEIWLLAIGVASFTAAAVIVANRAPPVIRPRTVFTLSAQKQAIRVHREAMAQGVRGDAEEAEAFTEDGPWIAVFTALNCEVCRPLDSMVTVQARRFPSLRIYWHFLPDKSRATDLSVRFRQFCARSARLVSERHATPSGSDGSTGGGNGAVACDARMAEAHLQRARELASALHLAGVPVIVGRNGVYAPGSPSAVLQAAQGVDPTSPAHDVEAVLPETPLVMLPQTWSAPGAFPSGDALVAVRSARLEDSSVFVVGTRGAVLEMKRSDGTVRAIGRRGEGPGEFRLPVALGVTGSGAPWIWDPVLHRLSVIPRGRGQHMFTIAVPTKGRDKTGIPGVVGLVDGGSTLVLNSGATRPLATEGPARVLRESLYVDIRRVQTQTDVHLGPFPGREVAITQRVPGDRTSGFFTANREFGADGVVVVGTKWIAIGDTRKREITGFDFSGHEIWRLHWSNRGHPITPGMVDAQRRGLIEEAAGDPERQAGLAREFKAFPPVPDSLPHFLPTIIVDRRDRVWVPHQVLPGDEFRVWAVWDPEARTVVMFGVESGARVLDADERCVLIAVMSENGEEKLGCRLPPASAWS